MKRLVVTIIILVLASLLSSSSISLADDATLDFVAVPNYLNFGETTTFTILDCLGTEPYKAEWDFDADGETDVTVVGTKVQIMLPVTWNYDDDCSFFSVILTITDSTSTTFREEKIDYILVMCLPLFGDANGDGVVDALDITKVERIIVGLDVETPGADANIDGVVNSLDITWIEKIIAGQVEQPSQEEQQALEALEKMPSVRWGSPKGGEIVTTIIGIGSGSKTSDWFTVDKNRWYIDWRCLIDPEYKDAVAVFNIYIYPKGETEEYVDEIENRMNRTVTSGSSGSRRIYASAGEYYIRVEAIGLQSWKLTISS